MNVTFMSARQDMLNLLDNAIARAVSEPRHSEIEHAELRGKVAELHSARDMVLALIIFADVV
jgi:hypothetical protein